MPLDVRHPALSFRWTDAGGPHRVWLVGEEVVVRGGLRPDVVAARCAASEYAGLPTLKLNLTGSLELWDATDPGGAGAEPDLVLPNWWLVDVEVDRAGVVAGGSAVGAIVYRLSFADHRQAWAEPRGGRLRLGRVNRREDDPAAWLGNAALATACLDAMGLAGAAPSTLDQTEPLLDLDWSFAHAPTALEQLCEHAGHGYCPSPLAGFGRLQPLATGAAPSFDAADVVADVAASAMDRRPQTVVIASAPTAVVRTYDETGGTACPAWAFVAQDPSDSMRWKPLTEIASIGTSPITAMRDGLPLADDEHRDALLAQMYRCIRLDPDRYPPAQAPLLAEVEWIDGTLEAPSIKVSAAVRRRDGAWVNRDVRQFASEVQAEAGVLVFPERLVRVPSTGAGELDLAAVAIPATELKPTFSVEDWDATHDRRPVAVWGFNLLSGSPSPIDEATATSYLSGYRPTVAVLSYPSLRRVWLNDATSNDAELATLAASYARSFLADASATSRRVVLRGLHAATIDGRVSEIRWDLRSLTTTLELDGWRLPARAPTRRVGYRPPPREASTAIQPTGVPERRSGFRLVLVEAIAAVAGARGRYTARLRSGELATAATGPLALANLGQAGGNDVDLWVLADLRAGRATLRAGDAVLAWAGPTTSGRMLCVADGHGDDRAVLPVAIAVAGGSAGSQTAACSYVYSVTWPDGSTATGVTPLKPRPSRGAMLSANVGLARRQDNGAWQLLDAMETPDAEACP